ncbi:MAG TPA: hypothetical protein VMJ12_05660 [Candidatus Acidoferrales bacterium]|nr:hypothetical protein [Candidatus Acidoferrales bacterium]
MKINATSRCGLPSRARFNSLTAIAAAVLLLLGPGSATGRADILFNAPSANYSYYGMYSPYATAVSFTLADSYYVSTIDVVLRTPPSTSFNTFNFSLQSALTGPMTVFASESLTAPLGVMSTQVMTVNETLLPGTYYLAGLVPGYAGTPVIPGNVDGWLLSTGSYNDAAGSIANGVWFGSDPPIFESAPGYPGYVAPAFAVIGSAVPEPSMWAMLALAAASLPAVCRRKRA